MESHYDRYFRYEEHLNVFFFFFLSTVMFFNRLFSRMSGQALQIHGEMETNHHGC